MAKRIDLSPDKRDIGMVFQSYALWPHMTLRKNIEYPLRAKKLKQGLAENWAQAAADLVEVGALLDRYPGQLSGGQQQRIALARGLVSRPGLVLFDEPLSNLDARLRDQVRNQLHLLHRQLGFTAVFVTHDQTEALSLADRIAVLNKGSVEQLGTAQQVFEEPATEYVAAFMGMTERLTITAGQGDWSLTSGAKMLGVPQALNSRDQALTIRIRPQDIYVEPLGASLPHGSTSFEAEVVDIAFAGRFNDVMLRIGDQSLQGRTLPGSGSGGLELGAKALVRFSPDRAAFYGLDGKRIALPASGMSYGK